VETRNGDCSEADVEIVTLRNELVRLQQELCKKDREIERLSMADHNTAGETLRKRVGELVAIHKAGQQLRYLQTSEQLARKIIDVLSEVVRFDYGAVLLIDEVTGMLVPYALSVPGHAPRFVKGDLDLIANYGMSPGKGVSGWVAQHCQSVCLGDVKQDPRYVAPVTYFHSELCVPLSVGDTVIGVVNVESTEPNAYGESDQRVLETVAAQIGVAIQNARLYEKAQCELTERRWAEEQLRASLKEKDVLLKEVHHRVKNNLQIITSLLNLQSSGICDAETLNVFRESQNRIRSMALMHEKLYQSRDLSSIDFSDYLGSLIISIFSSYAVNPQKVSLKTAMEPVSIGIDTAITCGLIVNELVTNVLKYAFPGPRQGVLTVQLHMSDEGLIELIIGDNGVGMPAGFDINSASTLGLQLVTNLVNQLDGQIDMTNGNGVIYRITFRDKKPS